MVEMYKSCIEGYWVAPQPHLCPLLKDDVDFTIHHFINNKIETYPYHLYISLHIVLTEF